MGGLLVRQEAWLRKGASENTGGENVGWGESPPRTWDKLTSKQRAARAERLWSRGMMDIPSDIKGVLLMERVVKWWAGENPGAPAKVYGAVLIALDGLATEVGLVVEHEISTLVKRLDRLVSEVDESKVVIQYSDPLRNVEDSQANKNTPTWWDFDHALAKAGNLLAAGTVWLGDQPSGLTATMAAKAKQLGSLNKPQNGPSDKVARFVFKWALGLNISEAVSKTTSPAQQVQNSLKSKPRVKGRIKKTYNKPRLGGRQKVESSSALLVSPPGGKLFSGQTTRAPAQAPTAGSMECRQRLREAVDPPAAPDIQGLCAADDAGDGFDDGRQYEEAARGRKRSHGADAASGS